LATTIYQPHYLVVLMLQDVTVVVPQRLDTARINGQNIGSEERKRERSLILRRVTVGKSVTVKASSFNKSQQLSTNGRQQVQY